jgi:ketosteroid isomerase-like protein
MQVIENMTAIRGRVMAVESDGARPGFDSVRVSVESTSPVDERADLLSDRVGQEIVVGVRKASGADLAAGQSATLHVRMTGPAQYVAIPVVETAGPGLHPPRMAEGSALPTSRERIERYFAACSAGSAGDIAAHFTADAVVYDTNVAPFRGAAEIGAQWVRVRERWGGARWTVDSCVAAGDAAAIEWTMSGTHPTTSSAFVFRGSEHYRFASDGLIDEIRQYWTYDPNALTTGLRDYPY